MAVTIKFKLINKMSQSATEERYVFECEWFDEQADLIRKYLLTYFPRN
jgi:hypothetical protein